MLCVGDVLGLPAVVAGLGVGAGLLAGGLVPAPGAVRVADDLLQAHDLVAVVARVHRAVVEVPANDGIQGGSLERCSSALVLIP